MAGPDYRSAEAPLETVEAVDLQRYAGRWYEIALYPNAFQRGCSRTVAAYAPVEAGRISVTNSCDRDGERVVAEGSARVVAGSNGARLKVTFAPGWIAWAPFAEGDYWVLYLDEEYQHAVVGAPNGRYLWFLSRTPRADPEALEAMKAAAVAQGFDLAPLSWTEQGPA